MLCRTAAMAAIHFLVPDWRPSDTGTVDSAILPIQCHYDDPDDADLCETLLGYAEESWLAQVSTIGFRAPVPDDDGLLDFYLTDDGTDGGAWTTCPYEDVDTTDESMGCAAYMAVDPDIPASEMKIYVAHEFNHVLQFATDFTEATLPMWEATAESAMNWTYPEELLVTYEARDFQRTPWMGILGDSYILYDDYDLWSYYEYGAALWIMHLDATWGDGSGSAAVALWENATQEGWANEPDVLDSLNTVTGDWQASLLDFSIQRARIGTDLAPAWADFLPAGAKIDVDMSAEAGDLPVDLVPTVGPYQTGVVYASVEGLEAGDTVKATVIADNEDIIWGLVVLEDATDTSDISEEITWTASGGTVTFGVLNLGEPDFDADRTIRAAGLTLRIERVTEPDTATDDSAVVDLDDTGTPPIEELAPGMYGGGACSTGATGSTAASMASLLALALFSRRRSRV